MKTFTRRAALALGGAALGWGAARTFGRDLPVYEGTQRLGGAASATMMNDASGLSPTPIHKHLILSDNAEDTLIAALRKELAEAANDGRPVNVGAARHSMGVRRSPAMGQR